ncbi:MAG: ATP-binding cassette domain-containing protein [Alphaproteobacteria bacterium]|nr:ATP-binding cassette domain-containing protein [Alphaproteobacteria bacterium]
MLALTGVSLRRGDATLLETVDLAVARGEIVTLIGPNGAGKTTLLRVALGLAAPDAGVVWRQQGLVVGYMPQRLALDETLPLSTGRFLGLAARATRERRRAVAAELRIEALLDRPVQRLSGGEIQRALLARALLRDPDLLVLDEPAQGLDVTGQAEFYRVIAEVRARRGCGVLLVSHDLHLVMGAADHVVCLNHHVCCTGLPHDVRAHPAYRALFPAVEELAGLAVYTHAHDHAHAPSGAVLPHEHAHARGHDGHAHHSHGPHEHARHG